MGLLTAVDIGSTYTKAAGFDLTAGVVIGSVAVPTTGDDVSVGLDQALDRLRRKTGLKLDRVVGCSSAAGGLRLVAVGLVPDLTVEAARRAALGAGARVVGAFGFELSRAELEKIEQLRPDMILLAGGTDGGNRETITGNAEMLSGMGYRCPVIVAGNKAAAEQVELILDRAGFEVRTAPNVMPRLYDLVVDPVRQEIRELFLSRIVVSRGWERAAVRLERPLRPTPAAVLTAVEMCADRAGCDMMALDVGGATTDVYSIAKGSPGQSGVVVRGLAEPYAKRTVEGDLGVRVSAGALLERIGVSRAAAMAGVSEGEVKKWVDKVSVSPWLLAEGAEQWRIDSSLAAGSVGLAVERHVGYLDRVPTAAGTAVFQYGKDLTGVRVVIGTGGPVVYGDKGLIRSQLVFNKQHPHVLRPTDPELIIDQDYLLAKIGLIADIDRDCAVRIAEKVLSL